MTEYNDGGHERSPARYEDFLPVINCVTMYNRIQVQTSADLLFPWLNSTLGHKPSWIA